MLKGKAVRLYYTAYNEGTGVRVSGDASHHTFKWSSGTTWSNLTVTPEEMSTDGVYTFILPVDYTNVDSAVILVKSSTDAVIIPQIELTFDDTSVEVSSTSKTNIATAVLDATVNTTSGTSLKSILNTINSNVSDTVSLVTPVKIKLDAYPAGGNIVTTSNQLTAAAVANTLLITDVSTMTGITPYSVASMILGGFCSSIDTTTKQWKIRKPNGDLIATRQLTTSTDLEPVIKIQ